MIMYPAYISDHHLNNFILSLSEINETAFLSPEVDLDGYDTIYELQNVDPDEQLYYKNCNFLIHSKVIYEKV